MLRPKVGRRVRFIEGEFGLHLVGHDGIIRKFEKNAKVGWPGIEYANIWKVELTPPIERKFGNQEEAIVLADQWQDSIVILEDAEEVYEKMRRMDP